jgi:hypothetical protein
VAEACETEGGDRPSASWQAVTRVNAEAAPKDTMRRPTLPGLGEGWYGPDAERTTSGESTGIPSDAVGICKYVYDDNETVYMGRGNIRQRLASPERADWDFSVVAYSIVTDPDARILSEDYRLTRSNANQRWKMGKEYGMTHQDEHLGRKAGKDQQAVE